MAQAATQKGGKKNRKFGRNKDSNSMKAYHAVHRDVLNKERSKKKAIRREAEAIIKRLRRQKEQTRYDQAFMEAAVQALNENRVK